MDASTGSVLFLAPEPLRASPTGPSRRAIKLAEVVAEHRPVTLAAPAPSEFPDGPFRAVETRPADDPDLSDVLAGHDVAVVQTLPSPRVLVAVRRRVPRLVVDLLAPLALEAQEIERDPAARQAVVRWRAREMVAHLAAADLVLCTNERQRDLLVGAALGAGLAKADRVAERIAVVPHGLDPAAPIRGRSSLRTGELSGDGLRIAIWGGGMWSWLDPLTAVRAVERLRPRRPDIRLAFVGFDHPDAQQRRAHSQVAGETRRHVAERGLGGVVVFRPDWLGRQEFSDHLADADVGVSLHPESLEGRYASRTRVLDYLESGLPVVATEGDTMSDVVVRNDLGRAVPPGDAKACATALEELTGPEAPRLDPESLERLRWANVAQPLVDFCLRPDGTAAVSAGRPTLLRAARDYPAFARAVGHSEGGGGLVRAAVRRAGAVARRRL